MPGPDCLGEGSEPSAPPRGRFVSCPKRHLFRVPICAIGRVEVPAIIDEVIASRGRLPVVVVNTVRLVNTQRDEVLRESVLWSDMILADGISVLWAGRLLGRPLPQPVPGIDLMTGMAGTRQRARLSRVPPGGH